ncbi:MAG: glycoside hydrolase family 19 protein [Cyanobacteria bacterium J06626_18]
MADPLAIVNGGEEPTGRVPFGSVFKIVLTSTDESGGTGNFALYTRYCQKSMFVDLGCTPYFIGPIPIWSTKEKGFVLTGPLDGQGGATGAMDVPPELQKYSSQNLGAGASGGGSYYGSSSAISMDDDCLDALVGALRHGNEAAGAREHIPRIIAAANEAGVTDKAQIAYILGTISTELEGGWRPTGERGVGCGTYGSGCYYGRGFVQLTWQENYAKMGNILGVDLLNDPSLANDPDLSAKITVIGMRDGVFTGRALDDYIGGGKADFVNARRIVNDEDKMQYTADQAERFLQALNSCSTLETESGAPAGDINAAIMDAVGQVQAEGFSASVIPDTNNGRYGCAGMVNYVLHKAGINTLGGGPPYGSLSVLAVEDAILSGRGVAVSPEEAQPGDINIIDMYNANSPKGHIGICVNVGCTQTISNSSSRAGNGQPSLTWNSDGYFSESYGGGRRAIYRVTTP